MKKYSASNIEITANTKEKYTRIKTPKFLFHDSYSHLSEKLDTLADNLKQKGEKYFPLLQREFPENKKLKACMQKLVYPYAYMDSFEKF